MSLLTTFGILFNSDAGEAAGDTKKLRSELEGTEKAAIEATDGIETTDQAAIDAGGSFDFMSARAVAVTASLTALATVAGVVIASAFSTDELGKFTETLGLSIEEVDAWGSAVERNGGSAESFRGSISSLNDSLTDISLTGGGDAAETLARLGISATNSQGQIKGVFELLPQLADSFQNLNRQEAVGLGKKLGLDQGTILLLMQGRDAVDDLVSRQKELGQITQEDYEVAAKFNDTWADTKRVFNDLVVSAATGLLPFLTKGLEGVQKLTGWMKDNQDLVVGFFTAAATAVTVYYLPAMAKAAAATIAATWPFIAMAAAIAAISAVVALVYEDIKAFVNGQDSLLGRMVERWQWLGDAINGIIGGIKEAIDKAIEAYEWLSNKLSFGLDYDLQAAGVDMNQVIEQAATYNPYGVGTTNNSQTNYVTIGGTNINTQASSPEDVRREVDGNLQNQIDMVNATFKDGVEN